MDEFGKAGLRLQVLDSTGTEVTGLNVLTKEATIRILHAGSGTPVKLSSEMLGSLNQTTAASALNTNVAGAAQTYSALTVPANSLKVGDKIRLRGQLIGTTRTSTDTCSVALLANAVSLFTLDTAFAHATTNYLYFDCELMVQAIGATGSVLGSGLVSTGTAGATVKGVNVGATAIDTTVDQIFKIVGTFSASNTTDQITVNIFDLDVIRPQV